MKNEDKILYWKNKFELLEKNINELRCDNEVLSELLKKEQVKNQKQEDSYRELLENTKKIQSEYKKKVLELIEIEKRYKKEIKEIRLIKKKLSKGLDLILNDINKN